ncbi:type VII toxin-antitoxin system HepT family RNase toxin [Pseudomonas viridiflava]|uniref:type VII toxin-antitoxin system HepT family RNase toxin n=1 Tax=Pseudomonas viridiflava TaxID=33069 RepID=UPI000F07EA84|nr:DUF86 domain-containing protein [Pseudomonas viridiflava]
MSDDVLTIKAASIERSVSRARDEYEKEPGTFGADITRQDAAIFNIQRACVAALDMGQHLIRREGLGVPEDARDVFELLHRGGWLEALLLPRMKNMVGFRNIAVHDYQTLQLPTVVFMITQHLGDFMLFSSAILRKDAAIKEILRDAYRFR